MIKFFDFSYYVYTESPYVGASLNSFPMPTNDQGKHSGFTGRLHADNVHNLFNSIKIMMAATNKLVTKKHHQLPHSAFTPAGQTSSKFGPQTPGDPENT